MRATLQVAQQELAASDVVRKVAQGLHSLTPRVPGIWNPARVAVELLEVENKGLNQGLAPVAPVLPYLGSTHQNAAIHYVCGMPVVNDVLGSVDNIQLFLEVMVLKHGAALKFLGDACLASPGA